ncbi:RdgB/HAM1 family non-canonical purine NTP pyrophosphatase [Xanthomonas rydalmerensis]|uniref:dITP/XTP pyrophosphatase n=1 Tax=Xanthomonas rydalmerensis TaxID=3046274 RepID=A0ABZ0JS08_9XANT|nr:RdgB/HAM1 family non-canonical purine NTP pyrophosphatase [Xanthomonas sp. DM-2023]WOS41808.1 RdgB/HAM1 family non-canonical purine NTP pyrophosphatase [Xanthomonas sp. DM-2023]WOS45994.1 RdgB/HAM1 family non-canonical purine NTP pyrophosphatase [Xanthomonas sp. DM-2023]WOS50173.1 RdgB/HAM1 family non-canonical purine NTP pyrophosphatase [Xanthomonas sp. DM-2023]WOS54352.1 RdgB/HAM1 family non-canonical purine NTP pyrophosphatase [Xanthomonas sp. DM-2023]WOS58535.1 RdgB/HAM1 family non-cano
MKLVLASSNAGKLEELHALLNDVGVELIAQSTLGVSDADETGLTFVENALLKARHAARVTGLPALADDSGICVDALHGAPGLYSARYAGEHGNAQANIDKLLDALRDVPDAQRGAHFYCVLVLLRHAEDPQPLLVEGRWRGRIAHARAGSGGHGYDPVFLDPEHGQTAAEMPLALKNRISHRALALQQLKQRLADLLAAQPAV